MFIEITTYGLFLIEIALVVLIFIVAYFGLTERRNIEKILRSGIVKEELEKLMGSKKGTEMLEKIVSQQTPTSEEEEKWIKTNRLDFMIYLIR